MRDLIEQINTEIDERGSKEWPQKVRSARDFIVAALREDLDLIDILIKFEDGHQNPSIFLQEFNTYFDKKINDQLKKQR